MPTQYYLLLCTAKLVLELIQLRLEELARLGLLELVELLLQELAGALLGLSGAASTCGACGGFAAAGSRSRFVGARCGAVGKNGAARLADGGDLLEV